MSSLLITQAHLLDPVAGELSDASWLQVADGRIVATGTGRDAIAGILHPASADALSLPTITGRAGTRRRAAEAESPKRASTGAAEIEADGAGRRYPGMIAQQFLVFLFLGTKKAATARGRRCFDCAAARPRARCDALSVLAPAPHGKGAVPRAVSAFRASFPLS